MGSLELFKQTQVATKDFQDRIMEVQNHDAKLPQVNTPITEYWSDGTYGREIFIPKGTRVIGEIHITPWIIVVSRGKIEVATDEGIKLIDATDKPVTFISPAGAKRAGYALEDTWWVGFRHVGNLATTEEIREVHIAKSYQGLEDKS